LIFVVCKIGRIITVQDRWGLITQPIVAIVIG
jgi:hypothetical protein